MGFGNSNNKIYFVRLIYPIMRNNRLPSISDIVSDSKEERIISYRKFFADLRLNRLHFQLTILNYFSNLDTPENSQSFTKELENYIAFFKKMDDWLETLKLEGLYTEFQEQCLDEIKAIEQIILSYEGKMKN
jgi:O6-methylguanine-DNA--protein-cysteine methyltransferase